VRELTLLAPLADDYRIAPKCSIFPAIVLPAHSRVLLIPHSLNVQAARRRSPHTYKNN